VTNSGAEVGALTRRREAGKANIGSAGARLAGTAPRRRLPVGERRNELINAALELLNSRPGTEVSMDDVASSAGASRRLVYHYFGSKQELYPAALDRAAEQLTALIGLGGEGAPTDRLAGALSRYFDYVEDHAAGYVALMRGQTGVPGSAGPAGKIGKIVDGVRQVVLGSILEALGVAAPGPVLRVTLRCWLACAEAAGLDWLANRDLPRHMLETMLTAQLVALLRVAARRDAEITVVLERLLADAREHRA